MRYRISAPLIATGILLGALLLAPGATATGPLIVGFSSNVTSGYSPLTVLFTDASIPAAFTSAWVFSDNPSVSYSGLSVTHTFASPGMYNVNHWAHTLGGDEGWLNRTGLITTLAPVPNITTLVPRKAAAGSGAFRLTVRGSNFTANSTVQWKGANRTTTFVSPVKITAKIRAKDVKRAGKKIVTVVSPGPGGGLSNAKRFRVT